MYSPLTIGNLQFWPPVVLAPMAGYTDSAFRVLCRRFGASLVYSELVIAAGVARRIPQSLHYLTKTSEEQPIAAQIYDSNLDSLAGAAQVIEETGDFVLIDLNCGCPVRKIVNKGAGAAMMGDPDRIYQSVKTLVASTSLPVTVKTRSGLSPDRCNISEIAQAVEEAGASAITIHARFASNRHTGPADWELLSSIKAERKIPVIGNGGVDTPQDALDMLTQTGVNGVMIGRAALGNPWIFREIAAILNGTVCPPPCPTERRAIIREHLTRLYELTQLEDNFRRRRYHNAESAACKRIRGHLVKYLAGRPGLRQMLRSLGAKESIANVMAAVDLVEGMHTEHTTESSATSL